MTALHSAGFGGQATTAPLHVAPDHGLFDLIADCGQPRFPWGPFIAGALIAGQVALLAAGDDVPVRIRPPRPAISRVSGPGGRND